MLTLLPVLIQVIAIVIWATFTLLVNVPLAASSRGRCENWGHGNEPADLIPHRAGGGRPLGWRRDPAAWRPGRRIPVSSFRSR